MMRCVAVLLLLEICACSTSGRLTGGGGNAGPLPDTGPVPESCAYAEPEGPVFYVATDGSDESGDGSEASPWASIAHAIIEVPDGGTILVEPGEYEGPIRLQGSFEQGVTIRSSVLYQARLRTTSERVLFCYSCSGITIEGFDIAHTLGAGGPLVVHIATEAASRVTIRNNILHDSNSNDILKINDSATDITVERNIFYNQQGNDEHIDINSAKNVLVQDNIFFNSFAASGRDNGNDTNAYIVIKDSNEGDDAFLGSENIVVRRNVFLNWEGNLGYNFLLIGEDGKDYIEGRNILIENNLMLGNSANEMRAPLGIKSGEDVTFRNNTVVGDMPTYAFAMRINTENPAVHNRNVRFYNNIWSDPTGTMVRFSVTPPTDTDSFTLNNNLYWNAGTEIPDEDDQLIKAYEDGEARMGDPRLGAQDELVVPVWISSTGRFSEGSNSSCGVFEALVNAYGTPAAGSDAIDAALALEAPDHDIFGQPRSGSPDIGAFEAQ